MGHNRDRKRWAFRGLTTVRRCYWISVQTEVVPLAKAVGDMGAPKAGRAPASAIRDRWFRVTESATSVEADGTPGMDRYSPSNPSATRRPAVHETEGLTPQARSFAPLPHDRFALSRMKGVATARPAGARHDPATKTRQIARSFSIEHARFRMQALRKAFLSSSSYPSDTYFGSTGS